MMYLVGNVSATGQRDLAHARARWPIPEAVCRPVSVSICRRRAARTGRLSRTGGAGVSINSRLNVVIPLRVSPAIFVKAQEVGRWDLGFERDRPGYPDYRRPSGYWSGVGAAVIAAPTSASLCCGRMRPQDDWPCGLRYWSRC